MHINKIDEFFNNVIDTFYVTNIHSDPFIREKILPDTNFIKFQQEINDLLEKYISDKINLSNLENLVSNKDSIYHIINTAKRYVSYYLFLMIGFFFSEKEELYISNIIEYSNNQRNFSYKVDDFFNSENNSQLFQFYQMIKIILVLISFNKEKINKLNKNSPLVKETINFLNSVGPNIIYEKFILNKSEYNVFIQSHNIIKFIILFKLYKEKDKNIFLEYVENNELNNNEYILIDIVVPTNNTIDFSSIEGVIQSSGTVINSQAHFYSLNFWNYLDNYSKNKFVKEISNEEKILRLINNEILIPITDEFLLFHKDNENYEKTTQEINKKKNKDETKLKYIVEKIELAKELYSNESKNTDKDTEIKKVFYPPLNSKKAVAVNCREDIIILNKFKNAHSQTKDNMDLFADFLQYKLYPYINFNNFENDGFQLQTTKTINTIRKISFDKTGEYKQPSSTNFLQTRISSEDMNINIVGFMIPPTIIPVQCIQIKNVIDIRKYEKYNKDEQNGVNLILKFLQKTKINLKNHSQAFVWLFDSNKDSIVEKLYDNEDGNTEKETFKKLVGYIYDKILELMKEYIIDIFKKEKISVQLGHKIIDIFKNDVLDFDKNSDLYIEIEQKLFEVLEEFQDFYDTNEDAVFDIDNLTEYVGEKKDVVSKTKNIIKINVSSIDEYNVIKNDKLNKDSNTQCHHNVAFDNISLLKKNDPKYSEALYKFIQQYVSVDVGGETFCKSCYEGLDLTRFKIQGQVDEETGSFETHSMIISYNLDEVMGYEKYKIVIRNFDKIIEKIAIVSNLLHLSKSSIESKSVKNFIIKNTIDIIDDHRKRHMNSKSIKENVTLPLSDYWDHFELTNEIFQMSGKDIDKAKFKTIKVKNIVAYLLFMMVLEINETNITYIGDDKKKFCNIISFEKMKNNLFSDLKIICNKNGDVKFLVQFPILCYIIYTYSCCIANKTTLYQIDFSEKKDINKNMMIFTTMKSIIHTIVDVTNSILSKSIEKDNKSMMYDIVSKNFFRKLYSLFNNDIVYLKLKRNFLLENANNEKREIIISNEYITLPEKFIPSEFEIPYRKTCNCSTFSIIIDNPGNIYSTKNSEISNITNCDDGNFHDWKFNSKIKALVCERCEKNASKIKFDNEMSDILSQKLHNISGNTIANKICINDGKIHIFDEKNEKCIKCGKKKDSNYSPFEIANIQKKMEFNKKNKIKKINHENMQILLSHSTILNNISHNTKIIKEKYNDVNDSDLQFILPLINKIQELIGDDFNNFNLTDNLYIIDHDFMGNSLDNNIYLLESQNKISFKENHPFFKRDVLYYTNYKNRKVEVYYDAKNLFLLGYREDSKNFVRNINHDVLLKLNYSFLSKFKLLGYVGDIIDVTQYYNDIEKIYFDKEDKIVKIIIQSVFHDRVQQLKKSILIISLIISMITHNHTEILFQIEDNDEDFYKEKIMKFVDKYRDKLKNTNFKNTFSNWKSVMSGFILTNKDIESVNLNNFDFKKTKYIRHTEINKIDNVGNSIVFYIFNSFYSMINEENNEDKTLIANFIVNIIDFIFDILNEDKNMKNIAVKRAQYEIKNTFQLEIDESSGYNTIEDIYNEYNYDLQDKNEDEIREIRENNYDLEQEFEGYDMDYDDEDDDNYNDYDYED